MLTAVRAVVVLSLLSLAGCTVESGGTGGDLELFPDARVDTTENAIDATVDTSLAADTGALDPEDTLDATLDSASTVDTKAVDTAVPDTKVVDTAVVDTAVPDTAPPCSEATGKMFGGHCYFTLTSRTQPTAVADCAAAGAHLVTVTSSAEHDFLKTVGTGDRWIGLKAPSPTNDRATYQWITGEGKSFNAWYSADPDNMGPCVAMHGTLQQWVDRGCGDSNAAICERE